MTVDAALVGLVVFVGVVASRAVWTQARARTRAERVRRAVAEGSARGGRTRLTATAPAWFVEALGFVPIATAADRVWLRFLTVVGCVAFATACGAGPILAVVVVVVLGAVPIVVRSVGVARRASAYDATLVVALDGLARAVRGGGSLHSAIGEAAAGVRGQVADDLARVATSVQRGARLGAALEEWRDTRDRASVRLAVGAIALAAQTGGPPARVIEDVASSLRTRLQIEGEARALGSQARLSALVVGVAPVGFALVACAADSRNAQLMFGTPIGITCVVAGLVLDVAGAVWMHRISETVLR